MNQGKGVSGAAQERTATHLRRFKPYPAYKNSGVEWLGEIPVHWEVAPLFMVARERDVRNTEGLEANVLSLSYGRIIRRDVSDNFGLMPESFDTYQIVDPGNIVLRLTDLQNDKRSLRVGIVGEHGIITSAYVALDVVAQVTPRFGFYLLHTYDVTKVFYTLGAGVRQTMKFKDLKWMPILIPEEAEQRAIAAFLDRETARIDALVAKKERLIELLQEKRTALIARAVSKGLDSTVPMKDSGVEWLGEIPEHWEVKPFKALLARNDRGVWGDDSADEGTIVLRSTEQTVDGRWLIESPARRLLTAREAAQARLEVGDLGVTKSSGSELHIGKTSIVDDSVAALNCGFSNFMQRLRVGRQHQARYFWYLLNCPVAREQFIFLSSTTTGLGNLSGSVLGTIRVPTTPKNEQRAIAAFLDRETARIDALVAKVRDAVDRLKELRTALISATVTGKIDVREEAA